MALVFPGTTCPICGLDFSGVQGYFATSAFLERDDPLWRYSDAAMHWACYLEWPYQHEFARKYASAQEALEQRNPYWHTLLNTADVFVTFGEYATQVRILFKNLAFSVSVPLNEFEQWLAAPTVPGEYPAVVQREMDSVLTQIKQQLRGEDHIRTILDQRRPEIDAKRERSMRDLGIR